jgi:hypothetical protein
VIRGGERGCSTAKIDYFQTPIIRARNAPKRQPPAPRFAISTEALLPPPPGFSKESKNFAPPRE